MPTWNYAVVHAYGRARALEDDARVAALLDDLVARYESGRAEPWRPELPRAFREAMQRGVVAFELPVDRIEGKFKLGQNRTLQDQESALAGLVAEDAGSELATFWAQLRRSRARPR